MSQDVIFADRILNISLQNGLVRMDLGVLEAQRKDEPQKVRMTQRLVLPLDGFVNSFQLQESVIKELIARQNRAREEQPVAAPEEVAPEAA